ncbi:MAG: ribosome assembly RNA-binding protein YhbY [Clostridia bacterium]|nr:ribosome assembly RNA-binding protein YhbY [Clostridia bacterium]
MITSKQRSMLRSVANSMDSIFQVGKNGLSKNLISQLNDALEAREVIKIKVLENCKEDIKDVARLICDETKSEIVQIIGSKIILYKKSEKNIYDM